MPLFLLVPVPVLVLPATRLVWQQFLAQGKFVGVSALDVSVSYALVA